MIVNGRNDCDSRLKDVDNLGLLIIRLLPRSSVEVGLSEPGFVNCQNSLPLVEESQHLDSKLLPHVLVPQAVGVVWHLLCLLELEQSIFFQGFPHSTSRYLQGVITL